MEIQVDTEFRALIPPLTPEERQQLKRNIEREGVLDPLKVWNGTILDGHNRLEICDELGIKYYVQEVPDIRSREHAKIWIIKNQLGRRNLNESQRAMLAADLKKVYAGPARERMTAGKANPGPNCDEGRADEQAARDMNVSRMSVHRAEKVKTDGTPELQAAVMSGDVSVSAAAEVAGLPENEQRATVAEGPVAVRDKAREMKAHFSSATAEWCTPPETIHLVLDVLGQIDLDPASNAGEPNVPALRHYTKQDDGLSLPWAGRVFLNPPYGNDLAKWTSLLCEEFEKGTLTEAIALLPARTDTAWFRGLAKYPRCFLQGRLKFLGAKSSAPFPSMLVYLGARPGVFWKVFSNTGGVYRVVESPEDLVA